MSPVKSLHITLTLMTNCVSQFCKSGHTSLSLLKLHTLIDPPELSQLEVIANFRRAGHIDPLKNNILLVHAGIISVESLLLL